MKNDLGIILLKMQPNPFYQKLFIEIKKLIDNYPYNQICIFNSSNSIVDLHNIPILHISEAKFFTGNMLVFDTMSLLLCKSFPNLNKIFFYVKHLPWQENGYSRYRQIQELLETHNLEYIAHSRLVYDAFDICWKQPTEIAEEIKYENLQRII